MSVVATGGARGALIAAAAAVGVLVPGAPADPAVARAPDLIHAHRVLSVQCVPGPSNTVRARVRVRMVVVNDDGITGRDWATHMEAKARLIPTTAGLNFTRSFRSVKTTRLLQNRRYSLVFQILTDNVSSQRDWNLQVRLTWVRPGPVRNLTRTLRLAFDESCAGPAVPGPRRGAGGRT
ncbi:MAG: hypothetical protein RIB67_09895 [Miltoncostaeaceae bacterium]